MTQMSQGSMIEISQDTHYSHIGDLQTLWLGERLHTVELENVFKAV